MTLSGKIELKTKKKQLSCFSLFSILDRIWLNILFFPPNWFKRSWVFYQSYPITFVKFFNKKACLNFFLLFYFKSFFYTCLKSHYVIVVLYFWKHDNDIVFILYCLIKEYNIFFFINLFFIFHISNLIPKK